MVGTNHGANQEAPWTMARAHGMAGAQTMGSFYWSMLLSISTVGKNHGWYPHVYGTTMVLTDLSLVYAMDIWDIAMRCAYRRFEKAMGSKREPMEWYQQAQ
jgi:hypothetical protein